MKLTVKNLGAVSHAEIDLDKRLLIFTGENNTGKTYLVYTVYQLYRLEFDIESLAPSLPLDEIVENKANKNYEINLANLVNGKSNYLRNLQKFISNTIQNQLADFFSAPKNAFDKAFIDFDISKNDISKHDISNALHTWNIVTSDFTENGVWVDKSTNTPFMMFNEDIKEDSQIDHIKHIICSIFHTLLFKRTYIFTAEREGINLFNKELLLFRNKAFQKLISEKKQTRELIDFMQTRFDRYPQPIRDALNEQNNYDVSKSKTSDYAHLAKELEDTFLKGDIVLNTEGDVVFKPKNMEKPLDIHLTSSTVKSLSSLIVYLRHTAKKGDSIIIDEPELNLHPDNQRKIARFFGRLINEGFKVLISTHSDYIVRELNNLIMLSHGFATKKSDTLLLLDRYNYNENELIAADKVGVYLFRVGQPVENVVVGDTGFNIATIDEEIRKLNQSSQDIYFTLFDQ